MSYDTSGGIPTRSGTYAKLMHHLEEAASQAAILSHLYGAEAGPNTPACRGWFAAHEILLAMKNKIVALAAKNFS